MIKSDEGIYNWFKVQGGQLKHLFFLLFFISYKITKADVKSGDYFIGTSAFMLVNLDKTTDEPPNFYQLNFGYQITSKDVISLELITWRYYEPLGTSYDKASDESYDFPGHVTGRGAGLAYQRFISGQFYSAIHATWLNQEYKNTTTEEVSKGNQLFMALRFGYRLSYFSQRLFIEPSIAVTHWPINTGVPTEFEQKESQWPKHQIEPGLHFGFLF